jgi:ParB family transcriptional regulator, chromosome partitioning protein
MEGKRARLKIADLKRRPMRQQSGTENELKSLAQSWLERPVHDIIVCPSRTVVDGHRRLAGLELLGQAEVEVFVTDQELDDKAVLEVGLTTAIHRADLSGFDKFQACVRLLELNPGWQNQDLARCVKLDPSTVTRLLSPSKCVSEVVQSLRENKIAISDAYEISKQEDREGQLKLLALKNAGASREVLAAQGRKQRAAATPAVRVSKIKCPLPTGQVITVSGQELSLDEAIDSLKEAIKAMSKARDTGLDAKTAMAVWKDMARAG